MIYTDTAEPVAHHLVASTPKNSDAPHANTIQFARNHELVANAALVSAIERLGRWDMTKFVYSATIHSAIGCQGD